jgi:hypothetical protein
MFYVIDDFYYISSTLYAYRVLFPPCGGEEQESAARWGKAAGRPTGKSLTGGAA